MICQSKNLPILVLSVGLLFTGCLEHHYRITARPDNSVRVDYELRGDRVDIQDGNELLPDSVSWSLVSKIEESEDETTHILKGYRQLKNSEDLEKALIWDRESGDSVFFQPTVKLNRQFVPFGNIWRFTTSIPSRDFIEKYGDIWEYVPEECRVLENDEELKNVPADEMKILELKFGLGVIQWNRARYELMFDRTWQVCNARNLLLPDENRIGFSVAQAGWIDDLHRYLNSIDVGKPQTANLVWWNDVRNQFIERFANLVNPQSIDEVVRIAEKIEKDYTISKDLEDDKFVFELIMPGHIYGTNGVKNDNAIRWEINGKEISNESVLLKASSFQLDLIQLSGAVLLAIVGVWYFYIQKIRKHTVEPNV